jgi:thioester reductase-like protein
MRLDKVLLPYRTGTTSRKRIVAVPGDLSRERFGLEPAAFSDLAMSIRAIYHCAAEVNFIAPYEKLAPINVDGVREIIRLATMADAVLHHVSSVAVFPYGGAQIRREDEDISKVQSLTGGYAQTKWVSERMIWKAISLGLRAVIYRPAQIVGRNGNSPHDVFDHLLHACKIFQAVPDIEADLDMVTSDYAASSIFALSMQERSLGKAFHLVNPEPVSVRNFAGLFPKPLPAVSIEKWLMLLKTEVQRCEDSSLHFVSLLSQGFDPSEMIPPRFDCSGTIASLRGSGIVCPLLDRNFIERELDSAREDQGQ